MKKYEKRSRKTVFKQTLCTTLYFAQLFPLAFSSVTLAQLHTKWRARLVAAAEIWQACDRCRRYQTLPAIWPDVRSAPPIENWLDQSAPTT
jgi:hypothetical protein